MATVIRAWRVENDKLQELPELDAAEQGLVEQKLEDWIESEPNAIQDSLLIIGRQIQTGSGPLDLLGLTADGKPIVVELKRDRAPRETVAQALDYASWIAAQTPETINAIAASYLKRPLEDAFQEKFNQQLTELQLLTPGVVVAASRLDAATERMIEYLSQTHKLDINGLVFRYVRLPSGEQILVRTSVVSEKRPVSESYGVETLIAQAGERGVTDLLRTLRKLGEFLGEEAARTYGGSFRYWDQGRMLCGVNVVPYWGAAQGTIDVWVSYGSWAQIRGLSDDELVNALRSEFQLVKHYEGAHQMILRIRSIEKADQFVGLLRQWYGGVGEGVEAAGDVISGDSLLAEEHSGAPEP
jgi:hypothetical protein